MSNCLELKKSNCKNCYKCIRHCPVKSIRFSGNQAHVVSEECILCGQCFVVCPQNAKQIVDETEKVNYLLQSSDPVVVSLAPSFVANYDGVGIEAMRDAIKALGFYDAEETAIGATVVKREYERILRDVKPDILITSCCHSVNLLIQKYFPAELKYLAPVLSPMQAHAADIKRRMPNAKVVFIGPCVAKKDEAAHYTGYVDAVLTFEDLTKWFKKSGIELEKKDEKLDKSRARLFPTGGGVLRTMEQGIGGYTYISVDGTENCIAALRDIESGDVHNCIIEMSSCPGSCIGGPVMEKYHRSPVRDYKAVTDFAGNEDFAVDQPQPSDLIKSIEFIGKHDRKPSETEIAAILRKMGKNKPEDELNCGSCGYNTCRDKAVAIFQGKADVSMCLPYLKEKAESFSDTIVNNSQNGLIVLNEELEVQQINRAACNITNIHSASDILGDKVIRILDPKVFMDVRDTGKNVYSEKKYLAEYDRYVDLSVIYDKEYNVIICNMRDISAEERDKEKKESISRQTIETADKVVDKQMRIVQEIASLLGETAAETKIALTKLKESIENE